MEKNWSLSAELDLTLFGRIQAILETTLPNSKSTDYAITVQQGVKKLGWLE